MNFRIGNIYFRPGLFTSLMTVIFLALFVRLGLWQLDRANYKAELYEAFTQQQASAPQQLLEFPGDEDVEQMNWLPVVASGRFLEGKQLLLDNRVINGQTGYFVYTPFQLENNEQNILVNRGWLPSGLDRSLVPALVKSDGVVTIAGNLKAAPRTGILLAETAPEQMAEGIYRLQEIKLAKLEAFLGLSLAPLVLRLNEDSAYGYTREWSLPGSDEQKHRGYAYQWFAFAAALLLIYVLLNFKKSSADE